MGKMLADLPVDIQIGKMLIMASLFHVNFIRYETKKTFNLIKFTKI